MTWRSGQDNTDELLSQVEKLEDENKFLEAKNLIEESLRSHNDGLVWCRYGFILKKLELWDAALRAFDKALNLEANFYQALLGQGTVYLNQNKYPEAEKAFSRALELEKTHTGYFFLAQTLAYLDEYSQAEAYYQKAINLNPGYDEAYYNLGVLLEDNESRRDDAEACFRKAIELDPKYALAYTQLGKLLNTKGNLEEAESLLRTSIDLDAHQIWPYMFLGNICWKLGRIDEAEKVFLRAIELFPLEAYTYNVLAELYAGTRRRRKAKQFYRKALEYAPNDSIIRKSYGKMLLKMGRSSEAREQLTIAQRIDPEDGQIKQLLDKLACESKKKKRTQF